MSTYWVSDMTLRDGSYIIITTLGDGYYSPFHR